MKRMLLVVMVGLAVVVAGQVMGARIDEVHGTISATLEGADSTGWRSIDKIRMADVATDLTWDAFELWMIVPAFNDSTVQTDSTQATGAIDTSIVYVYAGTGARKILIGYDSAASLPCTVLVQWPAADDTSAAGVLLPNDTAWQVALQDFVWFEYYLADSAGTACAIGTNANWFIRLFDKDGE